MANRLSTVFATAAGVLKRQFAELDDTGQEVDGQAIVLMLGRDEIPLPAILSAIRYEQSLDPVTGEWHKTMRRDAKVLPSDIAEYEISSLPIHCEIRIGEEMWTHDPAQTEWGTMFVKIGLSRDLLSRMKDQRRGGAV